MRSLHIRVLCAAFAVLIATGAFGQDPGPNYGVVPYNTYLGENENINLGSGNNHIQIPLLRLPGRNGHDFVLNLSFNSAFWWVFSYTPPVGQTVYAWQTNADWRWSVPKLQWDGNVYPNPGDTTHVCGTGNYRVQMWDGRTVYFPNVRASCVIINPNGSQTPDPGNDRLTGTPQCPDYWFISLGSTGQPFIIMENGEILRFDTSGFLASDEDSNGNKITYSLANGAWTVTDTVGRTITIHFAGSFPSSVSYTDSNGALQTITFNTQPVTLAPHFGVPQVQDPSPTTRTDLSSIVLPNGDRWKMAYSQDGYGELAKITYPTGGYTRYDYQSISVVTGLGFNAPQREVFHKYVCRDYNAGCPTSMPEDQTTFNPTGYSGYPPGNSENNVINAVSDETDYFFANGGGFETQRKIYSGSSSLLRTVDSTMSCSGASQRKVTLDDSQVSMTQWDHDGNDNITAEREYAYASGAPGSLVRQTAITWMHVNPVNSQDYTSTSIHILNRKASENIQDASGSNIAQTQYEYDNYTTAMTASGATQHDSDYSTTYTTRGNVTAAKRWLNTTSTWLTSPNTYDDAGNVLSATDPGGHTTSFSYADNFTDGLNHNAQAYVTQATLPVTGSVSHVEKKQYFYNTGLAAASCGQNFTGACTNTASLPQPDYATFTYERLGRKRVVTSGDGGQNSICYSDDPDGPCYNTNAQLSQTTSQLITSGISKVSASLLDGVGQVVQTQLTSDTEGTDSVDTTYDGVGRKKTVTNPHRSTSSSTDGTTTLNYDGLNRTTSVVEPDTSTVTTSYAGNTVTVIDEAGKQRKSKTDALGRLIAVWEAPNVSGYNYETDYQYDLLNNLACAVQKGTDSTQFTTCAAAPATWRPRTFFYDSLSQLTSANNPESGAITYTYDSDGNVLTKVAPKPNQTGSLTVTTTYSTDALHRLTQKSYNDGSTATVKYGYDSVALSGCTPAPPSLTDSYPKGRRTAMCDGSGATSWSHEKVGRVAAESRTIVGSTNLTKSVTYGYNLDGSLATLTYPSGRIVTYAPGAAGRPLSAIETAHSINYVTGATYAPPGELSQFKNGASLSGAMTYNSRLQPLQLYFTTGTILPATLTQLQQAPCPTTAATIMSRSYNLGAGTNDNGNVGSITDCLSTDRTQNFDYDNLNRLLGASTTGTGTTKTNWGEVYTVDPWGNLTNIAVKPGWHNSETLNAAAASAQNQLNGFCSDAAGNMTGPTSCPASTYIYDAENRLIATAGMSYIYDSDGKRVEKCTQGTTAGTCAATATGTLYWTGTGGETLAETDWTGAAVEEYVFFNGKRVARRDGTGNTVHYYFADHLGSTSIITSATGTIQKSSMYYPYGGEIAVTAPNFANNYKFNGKERDAESGLDEFGARYYSSSIGRFMIPDWAAAPTAVPYAHYGNPQSLNLYSYVQNNPTTVGDPDGHCPWCIVVEEFAESPAGQAVENWGAQAIAGAGVLITTAVAASGNMGNAYPMYYHGEFNNGPPGSSFAQANANEGQSGDKNVPNPNGSKGAPDHQQTADEEAAKMGPNGQREVRVPTPGGEKGSRVIDAAKVENGKVTEATQVVRPNKNGTPPAREVRAANDIQKATGVKPKLVPVRPCTNGSNCPK